MERNNVITCSKGCILGFFYINTNLFLFIFSFNLIIFSKLLFFHLKPFEFPTICSKHNYCYILYFPSPMHLLSISFSLFNHSIKILQFRIFGILPIFRLSSVLPLYSVFKMMHTKYILLYIWCV